MEEKVRSAPDIKTPLPGPKAKALIDRDKTVVSPSYTRVYPPAASPFAQLAAAQQDDVITALEQDRPSNFTWPSAPAVTPADAKSSTRAKSSARAPTAVTLFIPRANGSNWPGHRCAPSTVKWT